MSKSSSIFRKVCDAVQAIIKPVQPLIKPLLVQSSPVTSKMTSDIPIMGVNTPERLAHGQCPYCNATVYLWMTGDGIELSASSHISKMKAPPHRSATPEVTAQSVLLNRVKE